MNRFPRILSMLSWRLLLAACLLNCTPSYALDQARTLTQYSHRIWGQEEGLVQPTIYSIAQTRQGYLWLGTQDGLVRFDGVRFRPFGHDDHLPFERALIRSLAEDREGNLWIGSLLYGLARMTPAGAVASYTTKDGLPSNNIFCLVPGDKGDLWVCTDEGLAHWNQGRFEIYRTAQGLPSNRVRSTCEARDGTRWVAGYSFGLARWNGGKFEPVSLPFKTPGGVRALACSEDGSVWAGTEHGVLELYGGQYHAYTTRDGLSDNDVLSLSALPDGTVWAGAHDGISRIWRGEVSTYRTSDGLSHTAVLSLCVDREGSLWAGTKNGLDQFTDAPVVPYTTHEGLPGNDVGPLAEDAAGNLWIGMLSEGLVRFDGRSFTTLTTRDGLTDNRVLSLTFDRTGALWAGTERGITILRDGKIAQRFDSTADLGGLRIQSLFCDLNGVVWIGTNHGLSSYARGRFTQAGVPDALRTGSILALGGGRRVTLFASAEGDLLYFWSNGKVERSQTPGLPRNVISFLVDHETHTLYGGTPGSGLLRYRDGTLTSFGVRDGLYDNQIYGILSDDKANLWFASSKGVFRVAKADLENASAGRARSFSSVPFSTGQLRFECRAGVQPAAYRTHDGRLWFATTTGLVMIDPDHVPHNAVPPPVQIESLWVNGQRRDAVTARLEPFERNVSIRYGGLSFRSPEKVAFRYKLAGYDRDWVAAGSRREAFFTNLPPGHFRFLVMAANADGVWSTAPAVLNFSIRPTVFEAWWFYPTMCLSLAGLVLLAYRYRVHQLSLRFNLVLAERSRIARELHDTLLQGLSGITMQMQALWQKLPPSQEKKSLAGIIDDAGQCARESRESLWNLRPEREALAAPTDFGAHLESCVARLTRGQPVQVKLSLDRGRHLPDEVERQLILITQEAIGNALKHSHTDVIVVAFRSDKRAATVRVTDRGCGFSVAARTGLSGHYGIAAMRERAGEIGASFELQSAEGAGTTVVVRWPLEQKALQPGNVGPDAARLSKQR